MNDTPSLFDDDPPVPPEQLARAADPDTSHEAAHRLSTGKSHCLSLLRAHYIRAVAGIRGLTDHEAASAAGIAEPGICWWHRCSDLRKLGLIRWLHEPDGSPVKRLGPNDRYVRVSVITDEGRAEYQTMNGRGAL
jgi:hypothetical protein